MSRTISQLTPGTEVFLDEGVVHTPYIYLGLNTDGNAIILRADPWKQKRMNNTATAHYDGCEADVLLNSAEEGGFLSLFDEATHNALNATSFELSDYTLDGTLQYVTLTRRVFLPTYAMLGYATRQGTPSFLDALKTYYNTTSANTARIARDTSETAVVWWMADGYSASHFRYVLTNGTAGNFSATNAYCWLRPALSVAPATLVSDEGADAIFLLPSGRRTYWEVEATAFLGNSEKRPNKAKIVLEEVDVANATYKVSNNAKDTTPTWVNVTNGGVADLTNETKETTDWELGVQIEAQISTATGYVGAPSLIITTEEES